MLTAFLKSHEQDVSPPKAACDIKKYSKIQFLHARHVLILSLYTYITKLESYYQHSFMACYPAIYTVGSFLREL